MIIAIRGTLTFAIGNRVAIGPRKSRKVSPAMPALDHDVRNSSAFYDAHQNGETMVAGPVRYACLTAALGKERRQPLDLIILQPQRSLFLSPCEAWNRITILAPADPDRARLEYLPASLNIIARQSFAKNWPQVVQACTGALSFFVA